MTARNAIFIERMLGDRKLSLFVGLRDNNRVASIALEHDLTHESIFCFAVPVEMVDTFEKAVAYFQPIAATLEAPASTFNNEVAA